MPDKRYLITLWQPGSPAVNPAVQTKHSTTSHSTQPTMSQHCGGAEWHDRCRCRVPGLVCVCVWRVSLHDGPSSMDFIAPIHEWSSKQLSSTNQRPIAAGCPFPRKDSKRNAAGHLWLWACGGTQINHEHIHTQTHTRAGPASHGDAGPYT